MEPFRYDPLDLGTRSFRLLRLLGGDRPQIDCEIFEAWLEGEETIPFEALSYAWGNLATPHGIKLNGRHFAIPENLHVALQDLRTKDEDRILWDDAICIDQTNEKERGHQVGQMGEIYSQAEQVVFWLGHATTNVNLVMTALKQLELRSQREACSKWSLSDERWRKVWFEICPSWDGQLLEKLSAGLKELLQRPWFERVWILQEVARARRAVVCTVNWTIGSRTFAVAPTLLHIKLDPHCQAVFDIMPGPLRKSSWWSHKRDLYTLLRKFRHSKASDSRDMVYALLGISSSDNVDYSVLQPNYTKDMGQVIRDTRSLLFGQSNLYISTMEDFLDNLPGLWSEALGKILRHGRANDMFGLLQTQDDEFRPGFTELDAAASNERCGAEAVKMLYTQPEDYLSSSIIAPAIANKRCGESILRYIVQMPGQYLQVRHNVVERVFSAAKANIGCAPAFFEWIREQDDLDLLDLAERAALVDTLRSSLKSLAEKPGRNREDSY